MSGSEATATTNRALIEECVEERIWAVVGASTNPARWGYRIYRALKESGYRVYPVNPRAKLIDGDPCYPSLLSLPERPGVVDVVVPPKLGLAVADDAAAAGIPRIWFQPGAESAENVTHARALGLHVIHHACALVERRRWM
jgi:predicted CoA-binding protein